MDDTSNGCNGTLSPVLPAGNLCTQYEHVYWLSALVGEVDVQRDILQIEMNQLVSLSFSILSSYNI